ncbi:unnamed protein product [Ranitomeya imitator]|uniref:Reverse transcriptase domain-containing protein n=1 Tax=Ranitomeya imitator TaxID=111125 RepID=A0ABN9LDJ1_9NEOB|nr:unnamed protein product [Ranitomeya imitator]
MDSCLDRLRLGDGSSGEPQPLSSSLAPTQLALFIENSGWVDLWRIRHSGEKGYTCHSSTKSSLSRIDYIFGSGGLVQWVSGIEHGNRGISDHSPIVLTLTFGKLTNGRLWKLNPFWLKLIDSSDRTVDQLNCYNRSHPEPQDINLFWDALKAYLRGCLSSTISYVKRVTSRDDDEIEQRLKDAEAAYTASQTNNNKVEWLTLQRLYAQHLDTKSKGKLFFTRQSYFEVGNQAGKFLAFLVRQHNTSNMVIQLRSPDGSLNTTTEEILQCFYNYYKGLYESKSDFSVSDCLEYLSDIEFPTLNSAQQAFMDAEFTLEEIEQAITDMASGKAPGQDGFPIEFSDNERGEYNRPFLGSGRKFNSKRGRGGGANASEINRHAMNTRSQKSLGVSQLRLLQKGLSFCPTYRFDSFQFDIDLQRFYRNIRLKAHFSEFKSVDLYPPIIETTPINIKDLGLRVPSKFSPPKNKPPIETFIGLIEREASEFHKQILRGNFMFRSNLEPAEFTALKALMDDREIIIKPADKGGAIVVMDYSYYRSEILSQLSNREVYLPLDNNPTLLIKERISSVLEKALALHIIDRKTKEFLTKDYPIIPVFYVLPKIHKNITKPPGRPIVASTDSILSPLSILLEKVLTPLVKDTRAFLLDTGAFLKIMKEIGTLPGGTLLVTLDVNNLYTSIQHVKGIRATERILKDSHKDPNVVSFLLDLLELVLTENFFLFEDTFYVQVQGSAMGSNVAPPYANCFMSIYANCFMSMFESDYIYTNELFQSHCLLWRRYIDDVFCLWRGSQDTLFGFLEQINAVWPELSFTLNYSASSINFLDTMVIQQLDGSITVDLYVKETDRNNLLLYQSCHPTAVKKSIPCSQFERVRRIVSDPRVRSQRLKEMEDKFSLRGYPPRI